MGRRPLALLLTAAVVLAAVLAWQLRSARQAEEQAKLEAGLAASRVLSARFEEVGALRPARLSGEVKSQADCASLNIFSNTQTAVAPYSVNYLLDLSKIGRSAFRWDARDRIMFVEIPDVTAEAAGVDMSRARIRQTGSYISRACGVAMQGQVAVRLGAAAAARAGDPATLNKARDAARLQVARLVRAPLAAAGLGTVEVRVRLASDPLPADDTRWDVSRSIEEVLADAR